MTFIKCLLLLSVAILEANSAACNLSYSFMTSFVAPAVSIIYLTRERAIFTGCWVYYSMSSHMLMHGVFARRVSWQERRRSGESIYSRQLIKQPALPTNYKDGELQLNRRICLVNLFPLGRQRWVHLFITVSTSMKSNWAAHDDIYTETCWKKLSQCECGTLEGSTQRLSLPLCWVRSFRIRQSGGWESYNEPVQWDKDGKTKMENWIKTHLSRSHSFSLFSACRAPVVRFSPLSDAFYLFLLSGCFLLLTAQRSSVCD